MSELMEWKRWEVQGRGFGPRQVIEAPSKGVAIAYYECMHAIDSIDDVVECVPTDRPLLGSKEDVIQTLGVVDALKVRELDARHNALLGLQRRYAIAYKIAHALDHSFSHGPFETIKQALEVEPDKEHALLCEVYPEGPTIIKHYWNGKRWVVAGTLSIAAKDEGDPLGPVRYGFPGVFELAGIPALPFMCPHDQITDNEGKGRTVYVHRCAQCGKLFARTMMALVPVRCGRCSERKITL